MGVDLRDIGEDRYVLCGCCERKFIVSDLIEVCKVCNRWFCKNCAREVPAGHGHGKICAKCCEKIRRMDRWDIVPLR